VFEGLVFTISLSAHKPLKGDETTGLLQTYYFNFALLLGFLSTFFHFLSTQI